MESDNNQISTNIKEARRRVRLEDLTKEQLVVKCKGLLGLAQQAKQAKDDYSEKNKVLLAQLSQYESQKKADKESLLAMKEMIDNLTENKLSLTLKISDLENRNKKLNLKIIELSNIISNQSDVSIENEGLNRQLKRLTDENEDLINDLEKMESKLKQISEEYTELQRENSHPKKDDTNTYTSVSVKKLEKEEKSMETKSIEALNIKYLNEIKRMQKEEIKLLNKIQHLKGKINDVALKFKKLKGSRNILIENERDYSESVSKWQQDITLVSQKLLAYICALEKDKRCLQNRVKLLENIFSINDVNFFEKTKSKIKLLQDMCNKAMDEDAGMIKNIKELEASYVIQQNLNEEMGKKINFLRAQITELKTNKDNSVKNRNDNQQNIKDELEKVHQQNHLLEKSIQEHILKYEILTKEQTQLVFLLNSTQESLENLKHEKDKMNQEIENRKDTEKILKAEMCDLIENERNFSFKNAIQQNTQIERIKAENLELLKEMRELNEALKGRGDVISRQQNTIISLEVELNKLSKDKNSEKEIREKKFLNNSNPIIESSSTHYLTDNQSEELSLSSITKAEESKRMEDVNESLEEKYNKLKMLAVKMKRKIQDQKILITKLGKQEIEMEISKKEDKVNLEKIEHLNKIVIEYENENKILQERTFLLNKNISEKEKALEIEIKQNKFKEQIIIEKSKELKLLKQEKDAFILIQKEWEKEKDVLKHKLCDKETQINKLNELLEKLKKDLEKSKAIGKQSNVLNLEIEAYEKSLNENAEKLNLFLTLNQELSESVQLKDATISSLKLEISLLEEKVNSENTHATALKHQIDAMQTKFKQIEHEKAENQFHLQDCIVENELKHSELEELRLQLSDISTRKNEEISNLVKEKENILTKFARNEENLNQTKSKLELLEHDLENLRTKYASYKIRAQSVLRQNQSKEISREHELEEELITLQSKFEPLKLENIKQTELIDNQENKMDELRKENERIQKRSKEIVDLLEESREQYDSLLEENRKHSIDYQESLKSHRLQIETLTNCYKEQIIELEQKHSAIIEELKKKNNCGTLSRVGPFGGTGIADQIQISSDEKKVEILLMEREDAEGSEASYPLPKPKKSMLRSKHDVIPLELLLNSSLDENCDEIYSDKDSKMSTESELQILKEKLQSEEIKVKHLTSLLSETEQDLIKYTQLSEVLKDELRRQERTLEREKHMHNSEYLKNVILKFLTLNSGNERSRLVPVLNTILRLSPDEKHILQNVAKGLDVGSSWNLLPIWSNNNQ